MLAGLLAFWLLAVANGLGAPNDVIQCEAMGNASFTVASPSVNSLVYAPDGTIYALGPTLGTTNAYKKNVSDPGSNEWVALPAQGTITTFQSAAMLGGGSNSFVGVGTGTNKPFLFNASTGSWSAGSNTCSSTISSVAAYSSSSVLLGGSFASGCSNSGTTIQYTNYVSFFDISTGLYSNGGVTSSPGNSMGPVLSHPTLGILAGLSSATSGQAILRQVPVGGSSWQAPTYINAVGNTANIVSSTAASVSVIASAVDGTGWVYLGGSFSLVDSNGRTASRLLRWNGTRVERMGAITGSSSTVRSIAQSPQDGLVYFGSNANLVCDGVPCPFVGRWDPLTDKTYPVGTLSSTGITSAYVFSLLFAPAPTLIQSTDSGTSSGANVALYLAGGITSFQGVTTKAVGRCIFVSPSPSPSVSATVTPSGSASESASPSGSPAATSSGTPSASVEASPSVSASSSVAPSPSRSPSVSASVAASPSVTPPATTTTTRTASETPLPTAAAEVKRVVKSVQVQLSINGIDPQLLLLPAFAAAFQSVVADIASVNSAVSQTRVVIAQPSSSPIPLPGVAQLSFNATPSPPRVRMLSNPSQPCGSANTTAASQGSVNLLLFADTSTSLLDPAILQSAPPAVRAAIAASGADLTTFAGQQLAMNIATSMRFQEVLASCNSSAAVETFCNLVATCTGSPPSLAVKSIDVAVAAVVVASPSPAAVEPSTTAWTGWIIAAVAGAIALVAAAVLVVVWRKPREAGYRYRASVRPEVQLPEAV